ncbi:enterobactin exporter EntS [mine drainage metagenome]|uniref:Enterobactin exporter EntS n=1 Tax=mine drainage metagenome TaxID=410659 RepID=A0A1J5QUA8_9ZZZZ
MSNRLRRLRAKARGLAIDTSPLRTSRDFRLVMGSGLVTMVGSMVTYVTLPFQIKQLTGSYIAVGLTGAAELIPLIVFGLYGGTLADSVDRKIMVITTEIAAMGLSSILLANSLLHHPKIWVIYSVAALFATVDGLQRPSLEAMTPRIVSHDQLGAAAALRSVRWQFGAILGPALGGVLISSFGVASGYGFDIVTYVFSLAFLIRLSRIPSNEDATAPSWSALTSGLKYAFSRQDLVGTYAIDLAAMFFAMPTALFPFLADRLGAPWSLGLLYSAGMVGSIIATVTSGWVSRYHRHGRAVIIAAISWGIAIVIAGATDSLIVVLLGLAVAGGADQISGIFRSTIWNQTIPDELRGRLAGIELLSYSLGPLGGQTRAGLMASWTGLRASIMGGGALCVGAVGILSSVLPKFRNYDDRTNEFATAARKLRNQP